MQGRGLKYFLEVIRGALYSPLPSLLRQPYVRCFEIPEGRNSNCCFFPFHFVIFAQQKNLPKSLFLSCPILSSVIVCEGISCFSKEGQLRRILPFRAPHSSKYLFSQFLTICSEEDSFLVSFSFLEVSYINTGCLHFHAFQKCIELMWLIFNILVVLASFSSSIKELFTANQGKTLRSTLYVCNLIPRTQLT